jgi:hypothetical protein
MVPRTGSALLENVERGYPRAKSLLVGWCRPKRLINTLGLS